MCRPWHHCSIDGTCDASITKYSTQDMCVKTRPVEEDWGYEETANCLAILSILYMSNCPNTRCSHLDAEVMVLLHCEMVFASKLSLA